MKVTQDCINFMAEKNLATPTKRIDSLDLLHAAEEELRQGNGSGFRYVLDMDKLLS